MRIFVIEPNNSGGLVHYTYQLCNALAAEGADVTLVTAHDYEMEGFPHQFRVHKILRLWKHFDQQSPQQRPLNALSRKLFWNIRRAWRGFLLISAWVRLSLHILRHKPDLVQFTRIEFPFESFFIEFLQKMGLPLTQICHEFEAREGQNRLATLLFGKNESVYNSFSAIFFHANENRQRFFQLYPSVNPQNTHVIPLGNADWLFHLKPARTAQEIRTQYGLLDHPVIVFFGLLSPSKGLDDLVESFALVHQKEPNAQLFIAGYPTKHIDMDSLRAQIERLGLKAHTHFDSRYIPSDEVPALMNLASVVVFPYKTSTQSASLQTAYTFGKPVVATAVGGLPESVDDGKCGYLVPPRNPAAMAERILFLLQNPPTAERLGAYARRLAETRFGWQSIAAQILRIYTQILAEKD